MSGQALEPPTWPAGPRIGPLTVHQDSSMPSGPSWRSRGLCPSRPGCLRTAHPPSQQGGLNQSTCRGRDGPFKARTMEHSSCHQEKPTAGHSTPCHTCFPDRKRACSLGQPLHMRTFPAQSLVPEHQLLQWAQPRGRTVRRAAPWMPSPLVSGH